MNKPLKMIVMGASSGGVVAIQKILKLISDELELPIVIVQHIPESSRANLERVYGQYTNRTIFEALDKMPLEKNCVYFAPPNYHLFIERGLTFALNQEDKVNYSRPSIDMTFESAGRASGAEVCAVLLTGANDDGAKAMRSLASLGAFTIVQSPESAEVDRMPKAALKLFSPDYVGDLGEIADKLSSLGMEQL